MFYRSFVVKPSIGLVRNMGALTAVLLSNLVRIMGELLESVEAFKAKALEVNLSSAEVNLIVALATDILARVAFAACRPG